MSRTWRPATIARRGPLLAARSPVSPDLEAVLDMGYRLVSKVIHQWGHLSRNPLLALLVMAEKALDAPTDGRPACLYFGGLDMIVNALPVGGQPSTRQRAAERALSALVNAGAAERMSDHAHTGSRQVYRLTLDSPAESTGQSEQDSPAESTGQSEQPTDPNARRKGPGNCPAESTGKSPVETTGPKNNRGSQSQEQPVGASRSPAESLGGSANDVGQAGQVGNAREPDGWPVEPPPRDDEPPPPPDPLADQPDDGEREWADVESGGSQGGWPYLTTNQEGDMPT